DELHSLVTSKRGDLLSLGLARLFTLAPQLTTVGLSATVAEPDDLRRFLVPQSPQGEARADLVIAKAGAQPNVAMLDTEEHLPWAGHSARHALGEIYGLIKTHKTTLIFVNTRSQAEFLFQELWRVNDDNLAIALHHGSLDVAQRRRVEGAMVEGKLRAVVCTSSLDLGVDWGDVDLVINVGAPKGCSRLQQRIGRSNHRLDEPSEAVLVPANRFEVLNVGRRSTRLPRTRRTRRRCAPVRSTFWHSTFSAARLARRFFPTSFLRKYARLRPMPRSAARISTPRSILSRPAATR